MTIDEDCLELPSFHLWSLGRVDCIFVLKADPDEEWWWWGWWWESESSGDWSRLGCDKWHISGSIGQDPEWANPCGGGMMGKWAEKPSSSVTEILGALILFKLNLSAAAAAAAAAAATFAAEFGSLSELTGEQRNDCGGVKVRPRKGKGEAGKDVG